MQGRLIGKRFHAGYFFESAHDETHGCDYLLACDIDMEPVPGYQAASWQKGYGDFVLKPDIATMRRIPWLEGTALVICDLLDHHHDAARRIAPRSMLKRQLERLAAMDMTAMMASELEFFLFDDSYDVGRRQGLSRPEDGGRLHPGLPHPPDHQGGGRHAGDPQRPAGRRHPGREFQGRVGAAARKRSMCAMPTRWTWPTAMSS